MMDTIVLGLKDIFRNIKIFIILILSVFTITIIFVSSSLSIFYTNIVNDKNRLINNYQLVPTSTDMSNNKQLVNDYFNYINENGVSYIISNQLTDQYDITTLIVIGNSSILDKQIQRHDETIGFIIADTVEPINKINFKGEEIKLKSLSLTNESIILNDIAEKPLIIICLNKNEDITSWINYKDGGNVLQLFENSIFSKEAKKYEKELLKFFDKSFITMHSYPIDENEKNFIYHYIYPFVFITALCVIISFWIFYSYFLKKMYREYMIHILYGAQKKDILLRNSVVMLFIFTILCLMFSFIKKGESSPIVNLGYIFITILIIIFETITIFKINSNDKLKSIKGVNK